MEYPKRVRDLLERAGAIEGDSLEVSARGKTYEGVLMPHHSFSGEDILTVKLVTGYNIGIAVQDVERVAVLRKAATVPGGGEPPAPPTARPPPAETPAPGPPPLP